MDEDVPNFECGFGVKVDENVEKFG